MSFFSAPFGLLSHAAQGMFGQIGKGISAVPGLVDDLGWTLASDRSVSRNEGAVG